MLTLIRRTLSRIFVVFICLMLLLALFEVAIVVIAGSLHESGGFERIAGLVPAFIQNGLGLALTSFGGMAALGFFEPLIVVLVVQFTIFVATEPAGDVESGLVDLVLARPRPRHQLITRSLIVMTLVAWALPLAMALSMWASLWWLSPEAAVWPARRVVWLLIAHLAAVSWCFGGSALAAAAWARRRGAAQTLQRCSNEGKQGDGVWRTGGEIR